MNKKLRDATKEWLKLLMPLIVIGVLGLVAVGKMDARVAGVEQRVDLTEKELRLYRETSTELLKKVSRIEGYLRALSESRHLERKDP